MGLKKSSANYRVTYIYMYVYIYNVNKNNLLKTFIPSIRSFINRIATVLIAGGLKNFTYQQRTLQDIFSPQARVTFSLNLWLVL